MQGNSSALNALTRRAQNVSNEAAGLKIVNDIGQRRTTRQAELEAIRKSVSQPALGNESALARLQRLSGQQPAPQLAAPDAPALEMGKA
jgi:hypothetical protein